ncbi:hypothetical protein Scep_024281 [Stephania cephalantha]|uniref:Uncharacterized protein n=1 Tax=Stephania cephalantha TaxID=152367 RepID=A0AAP0EW98_9MAGN
MKSGGCSDDLREIAERRSEETRGCSFCKCDIIPMDKPYRNFRLLRADNKGSIRTLISQIQSFSFKNFGSCCGAMLSVRHGKSTVLGAKAPFLCLALWQAWKNTVLGAEAPSWRHSVQNEKIRSRARARRRHLAIYYEDIGAALLYILL